MEIVFVIERDRAALRLVKSRPLGVQEKGEEAFLEVLSGVSPGERVAVSKLAELRDGIRVEFSTHDGVKGNTPAKYGSK